MPRIAIFSVSAGAGHVRAAQALEAAGTAMPGVEVVHVDLMSIVSAPFRAAYADGYLRVVRHGPAAWRRMYHLTDAPAARSRVNRAREAIERANLRGFRDLVRDLAPDAVACTHFLPAALMAHLAASDRGAIPTWVVVTDFDVHGSWIQPGMAGYLAAHDAVVERLVERGIERARTFPTGIPVAPAFAAPPDRAAAAAGLGLDPARPTVALVAGSNRATPVDRVAASVLDLDGGLQVAAVAGRDTRLLGRLRAIGEAPGNRGRLAALAHTATMERVMAAADVAVAKPGGLIVSECLALGLPMVLVSPIPGQEERNARFLVERGAAVEAARPDEVTTHVRRLVLGDPAAVAGMRAAARGLGRPRAATAVLETILRRIG